MAETVASAEQETRSRVELGRSELAGHVGSVGQALQDVSKQLRDNQEDTAAQLTERVGHGIQRLSEYLENRDSSELLRDARTFARNNPGLFLGGAALLGFAAARFLRSSEPHELDVGGGIGGMRPQESGSSEEWTGQQQSFSGSTGQQASWSQQQTGSATPAGSSQPTTTATYGSSLRQEGSTGTSQDQPTTTEPTTGPQPGAPQQGVRGGGMR